MKTFFTILTILFGVSLGWSQNPLARVAYSNLSSEGNWQETTVFDYSYQNGLRVKETTRTYNQSFDFWYVEREQWLNNDGTTARRIFRNFIGPEKDNFYVSDTRNEYDESGKLVKVEYYIKPNANQEVALRAIDERTYIDDCTYIQRSFVVDNLTDELVFTNVRLRLFDEACTFIDDIRSNNPNATFEDLRRRIRVEDELLDNGGKSRTVFLRDCSPNGTECEDWFFEEKDIYDNQGRLVFREVGANEDFVKTITTNDYQPNQTLRTIRTFIKFNPDASQQLSGIEEVVLDLEGQTLYRKRAEPSLVEEWTYERYDNNFIKTITLIRTRKDSIQTFVDERISNFTYEYYCDGLASSQTRESSGFKSKTTYGYLYPADCNSTNLEMLDWQLFPNPTQDFLQLSSPQFTTHAFTFEIRNQLGQLLTRRENIRVTEQSIPVDFLPNGNYYFTVRTPTLTETRPFIIQR
ncbi:MAG: T9SS type A sorting domain-containing protein [Bacteroidota bacterium]